MSIKCTRKVTDNLYWVGADDRRLSLFEGLYKVPNGISYNSYLLLDEKTVLFDTADKAVREQFLANISGVLGERPLDYLVVHHMESDHSATLADVLKLHPETTVVCNQKTLGMMKQFFGAEFSPNALIVKEGDVLETGKHTLSFVMAPMVHWPEVMMSYDKADGILFTADAFGTFGALNGALFADEVDFFGDYLSEARRYYTNIVGKYGVQVQAVLKKAAALDVKMLCPLHGLVFRDSDGIAEYLGKYGKWSLYEPEEKGVLIVYGSIYGNTESAANALSCKLRDKGIKTAMCDVSVTEQSQMVSEAFKYSHIVFASVSYNAGIFVRMEELIRDLTSHNLQNRTVAFIENGTWAVTAAKQMRELVAAMKNMTAIDETVSIKTSPQPQQEQDIEALAEAIAASMD